MSSGDLLLLSELFLAQLLRDLECRNSPFEFVSFFFPSGCFFFGKIVMISKRESELFRRSFHRTTNQARQAPASCCLMTSIYGMREKARTYGTLEGMRSWRSETWDEYLRSKVLGNSIYTVIPKHLIGRLHDDVRWLGWPQLPERFASILALIVEDTGKAFWLVIITQRHRENCHVPETN